MYCFYQSIAESEEKLNHSFNCALRKIQNLIKESNLNCCKKKELLCEVKEAFCNRKAAANNLFNTAYSLNQALECGNNSPCLVQQIAEAAEKEAEAFACFTKEVTRLICCLFKGCSKNLCKKVCEFIELLNSTAMAENKLASDFAQLLTALENENTCDCHCQCDCDCDSRRNCDSDYNSYSNYSNDFNTRNTWNNFTENYADNYNECSNDYVDYDNYNNYANIANYNDSRNYSDVANYSNNNYNNCNNSCRCSCDCDTRTLSLNQIVGRNNCNC
ncbi:hypothetical protein KQI30_07125 [Clostridium bornimense]|uniref:hypothetical protein n=1 Tax=Clostridium bornimense TaxID=1216932 RepID=UPI001C109D3C|nr:hypothetical protein [Clostridium bornimense]MBU5316040.1 hypothetical protein [Clostridium bornimense]